MLTIKQRNAWAANERYVPGWRSCSMPTGGRLSSHCHRCKKTGAEDQDVSSTAGISYTPHKGKQTIALEPYVTFGILNKITTRNRLTWQATMVQ
jgi:hypothetical protein